MIVMPANATGWFWHILARETGRIGHLYSPRAQNGPWPWFPYACDNGAFSCWNPTDNTFDAEKWAQTEQAWRELMLWCQCAPIKPRWCIVPDVPGNASATFKRYEQYVSVIRDAGLPVAIAVQDGMTPSQIRALSHQPTVICVGGTTEWKWETAANWAKEFPRVHVLRCNSPQKLYMLEEMGVESCDGTGWNRGDRNQTRGLEEWARSKPKPHVGDLWPLTCRQAKDKKQLTFA